MLKYNNYSLRSIQETDLKIVLQWRNSDRIRKMMFFDRMINWNEHLEWFEKQKKADNDRFQIFESNNRPIGVINLLDYNIDDKQCRWGFYLGVVDPLSGSGTVLGYLGLSFAFEIIGIQKVIGEVFEFNEQSCLFHQKLGFIKEGKFKEHITKNGIFHDVLIYSMHKNQWETNKALILDKIEKRLFKERSE